MGNSRTFSVIRENHEHIPLTLKIHEYIYIPLTERYIIYL